MPDPESGTEAANAAKSEQEPEQVGSGQSIQTAIQGQQAGPGPPHPEAPAAKQEAAVTSGGEAVEPNIKSEPAAPPSMDAIYQKIMQQKASTSAENHNNSNSKLAAGALQSGALGSTGAMGPAGALAPNGTSNGSDKPAGTGFRLGDLSVGGDLGTFGLGSLNNLTAGSLDIAAMRQLTVMRSSNMEHLLGALTAGQDGSQLFSFNSLTQDKFLEGLQADMRDIEAAPPDVRAMRRTFTVERILSGGEGDIQALVREAQLELGSTGLPVVGVGGVTQALLAGGGSLQNPPGLVQGSLAAGGGAAAPATAAAPAAGAGAGASDAGGSLEPDAKRQKVSSLPVGGPILQNIVRQQQQQQGQGQQQLTPEQEMAALEADNAALQAYLDIILGSVDAIQQENMQMKQQLLETCQRHGIAADLSKLNQTIAAHRPPPLSDIAATHIAARALHENGGNVVATVKQLLATGMNRLGINKGSGGSGAQGMSQAAAGALLGGSSQQPGSATAAQLGGVGGAMRSPSAQAGASLGGFNPPLAPQAQHSQLPLHQQQQLGFGGPAGLGGLRMQGAGSSMQGAGSTGAAGLPSNLGAAPHSSFSDPSLAANMAGNLAQGGAMGFSGQQQGSFGPPPPSSSGLQAAGQMAQQAAGGSTGAGGGLHMMSSPSLGGLLPGQIQLGVGIGQGVGMGRGGGQDFMPPGLGGLGGMSHMQSPGALGLGGFTGMLG